MDNNMIFPCIYAGTTIVNCLMNWANQSNQRKEAEKNRQHQTATQILSFLHQQQLAEQGHFYRLNEALFSAKLQEQTQRIIYEHNKSLEEIRYQNNVKSQIQIASFNYQLRQLDQWEKNHPFLKPSEQHILMLKQIQRNAGLPLILTASFADDSIPNQVNDSGGFIDYRIGNYTSFQQAELLKRAVVKDGYFERPLRQNDRDLDIIYGCLSDIPVIVVNGYIQYKTRVFLQISHWGIIPGLQGYVKDLIGPYEVPSLTPENQIQEMLKIQDKVAQDAVIETAVITDIYHLLQPNHIRPNVTRYGIKDQEKLQFWAEIFGLYYEILCEDEPQNEPLLRLDQAQMLGEVGLKKQALNIMKTALSSWCFQKNIHPEIFPNALNQEIMEKLSNDDLNFLLKLGKGYQLIGDRQKASQIFALTEQKEQRLLLIEGISQFALNIEVKNVGGIKVYYELVERFEHLYLLAYWRDEDGYKAGVVEGIELITPLTTQSQLNSDGMIDFKTQKFNSLQQIRKTTINWLNDYSKKVANIEQDFFSYLLGGRNLNYSRQQEIKNILETIPNIDAKEVEGVIVWYEWIKRPNCQYQLAYWHDEEGYKAGVVEGVNPNDLGNSRLQIFADGRLMLDNPTDIISTRFQAITWVDNYEQQL